MFVVCNMLHDLTEIQIILPSLYFRPRRAGPEPNSLFGEEPTMVTYIARDRAGNTRTCSIKVVVNGELFESSSKN